MQIDRRRLIAGLGGALLLPSPVAGQPAIRREVRRLILRARPATRALRSGEPPSEIWALEPADEAPMPSFRRGDNVAATFHNDLSVPAVLNWHGLDGNSASEPLTARAAVPPGGKDEWTLVLNHAGTLFCEARLLGDGQSRATGSIAQTVQEDPPVTIDRDEVLLIEDWRIGRDGNTSAPGTAAEGNPPLQTVNGKPSQDITLKASQRLRIRFINGCQRNVIAVKIQNHDMRVMAIDGQPSEPFMARDSRLVLAPGTRIDALIDAAAAPGSSSEILLHDGTQARSIGRLLTSDEASPRNAPLPAPSAFPSNGLPEQLDLKAALRTELSLNRSAGESGGWITPAQFKPSIAPAFRVKRNRTVVVALTNRTTTPVTFHLHGHHFRLLDRLDDGWKPFWLDTLLVDTGQTQRIAFKAEFTGVWLLEAMAADWAASRLVRTYAVE